MLCFFSHFNVMVSSVWLVRWFSGMPSFPRLLRDGRFCGCIPMGFSRAFLMGFARRSFATISLVTSLAFLSAHLVHYDVIWWLEFLGGSANSKYALIWVFFYCVL